MFEIQRAVLDDVAGIASVVAQVWEQEIEVDVCKAQVNGITSALWVAKKNGNVVGFVSTFLTVGAGQQRRWEIDLLAVHPSGRGHQLGQKLIEAVWADAQKNKVHCARAVIRADNIASQKSFRRAGYTADAQLHKLLLWSPENLSPPITPSPKIELLAVDTLTYRGLWIEGLATDGVSTEEQRQTVQAARAIISKECRSNTGALIPVDNEVRLSDELRTAATEYGSYHLWRKCLDGHNPQTLK